MKFYSDLGKVALGSRLRRLSERITEDAAQVYQLYQVNLQPKWFPVFYVLSQGTARTITAIAEEIGHSHPSVSKIVREMAKHGLVVESKDRRDGRKNVVSLSEQGQHLIAAIEPQYVDVNRVVEDLLAETEHNLWKALKEWEFMLEQKSFLRRVQEQKKQREGQGVTIVPYEPRYQNAFKSLNEQWITQYFALEDADRRALDHPQTYILDRGGYIVVALYQEEPVGVCALIAMPNSPYDFELAKMAVAPPARGKSIGWQLGQAVIEKARSVGATKLYLESNTVLAPAIQLYHKLGFRKIVGYPSPYQRCNIQMELVL